MQFITQENAPGHHQACYTPSICGMRRLYLVIAILAAQSGTEMPVIVKTTTTSPHLEGSRSSRLPSARHPRPSRSARHLRCSGPWPSCCLRRSAECINISRMRQSTAQKVSLVRHGAGVRGRKGRQALEGTWPKMKLSGLKIWPNGPERTESMVPGSCGTHHGSGAGVRSKHSKTCSK